MSVPVYFSDVILSETKDLTHSLVKRKLVSVIATSSVGFLAPLGMTALDVSDWAWNVETPILSTFSF